MDNLPPALLRTILSFVGNAADFRSCEKTCSTLNNMLEDDGVWALCFECKPKDYDRPYHNKELALIPGALERVKKWQRKSESVILSVLGMSGWKGLLCSIAVQLQSDLGVLGSGDTFSVRGDTSAVLLRIVEDDIIMQIERAFAVASHVASQAMPQHREFPCVSYADIKLQNLLLCKTEPRERFDSSSFEELLGRYSAFLGDNARCHTLVCRLASRAGVPKMEYDARKLVWSLIARTIICLLHPACETLVAEVDPRALHKCYTNPSAMPMLPKRVVATNVSADETIRMVPPLPRLSSTVCCPRCRKIPVVYTIVPKQIEDTASLLQMGRNKVYGSEWHVDEDTSPEGEPIPTISMQVLVAQSILEAKSWYNFHDGDSNYLVPNLPTKMPNDRSVNPPPSDEVLRQPDDDSDGDIDIDGDGDREAYVYEDDEDEEDLSDSFVSDVDELVIIDTPFAHGCVHPDGFVEFSTVPDMIL